MALSRSTFAAPFRARLFASASWTLRKFKALSREPNVVLSRPSCYRFLSSFEYRPLDATCKEIRLISIQRRKPYARADQPPPISCSIQHVSLDTKPDYMALSYVWGDPNLTIPILINGEVFNVTENLWQALNHLESEPSIPHTLWIDAICINQQNNAEKSAQIQLMKDIYSQADLVLAWLGPSGEYGGFLLEKLERIGNHVLQINSAALSEGHDADSIAIVREAVKKLSVSSTEDDSDLPFHLLVHIFGRDFWDRIWIIQEIYFAQKIVLMCGAKLCPWLAFVEACAVVRDVRSRHPLPFTLPPPELDLWPPTFSQIETQAVFGNLPTKRSLQQMLANGISGYLSLRFLTSSDPRDMIYALLNLSDNSEILGITPDYSKSVQSVFTQVAKALLLEGHFGILAQCHFPNLQHGLPSWAPDWSVPWYSTTYGIGNQPLDTPFKACGMTGSLVAATSSNESSPKLSIAGVRVGAVYKKGTTRISPNPLGFPTTEEFEEFMDELDKLARIRREQFSGTSYNEEIWRIPIANSEVYEDLNRSMWAVREPTLRMYNSYRAIRRHQNPPNDCADEEKWRMDIGRRYLERATLIFRRTPFLTDNGYLGMGPRRLREGDIVVIFLGAGVPFIIREVESGHYEFVGESYVQGIMQGEFMEGEHEIETFILR